MTEVATGGAATSAGGEPPTSTAGAGAWDAQRPPSADLIKDCVHCGFCLPTCPSYVAFGEEMDSPRGRILLMRVGHEEGEQVSLPMLTHFDRCLGCMACVTACPSGVQYDRLIEQTRPQLERNGPRTPAERRYRAAIFALFTHPGRLRAMVPALAADGRLGIGRRLGRALGRRNPASKLKALTSLAPRVPIAATTRRLPVETPGASGVTKRGRIAFMQGCIQRVLFGDVNAATVRVLAAEGWDVVAPRQPRCCGALQLHSGIEPEALALARQTIARYEGYDAIAVNVAGCGSAMKDYGHLLEDDPQWSERAKAFSAKVKDVHELLDSEPPQAKRNPIELTLAYHDACHLAHAQAIRQPPRNLLRGIPGVTLVEPKEWELCCGSAGIYNLTQPEAAEKLGRRKAANLAATGAAAIAAANPGCALQIAAYLSDPVPVYHPMTLLDASIRGVRP
jgi:glycolate oxidase iron-sulfur subunit